MPSKNSFREQIIDALKKNPGKGFNKSEFARTLQVEVSERSKMRKELIKMEQEGLLSLRKKARYHLAETAQAPESSPLTGVIRLLNSGHGLVKLDELHSSGQTHVFIPLGKTSTALPGDLVLVELESRNALPQWMKHSKKHRKRYEEKKQKAASKENELTGRVTEVLKRADHSLVGTLFKKNGRHYVDSDSATLPNIIQVEDIGKAKVGQQVVLSLSRWDAENLPPIGAVKEILGWQDEPGVDILGIIHQHNLSIDFPQAVQREADETPLTISSDELDLRLDCRKHPICTIDPHDARDHDDAVWVERLSNEGKHTGWRLQVHIADVSHYVKPGTELDKEAFKRGNSTYLVDRVIPMLPTVLSNGICSLVPDEDRLTKCALITFDPKGRIKKTEFHSAVIRSKAKLSYEEAQRMIEDSSVSHPLAPHVREAWKLASLLRKKRFASGALDLEFPEYRVNMTDEGKADGYRMSEHLESHQLVEEFMLVANETAALTLKNAKRPTVYRVHEDPDYDKLEEFGEMARILGFKAGDLTSKQELQNLINQLTGSNVDQTLKLALLKSLKRASYNPEPLGHYGLAKTNYTHFTSPIRRYADLIVHRSLQTLLKNKPKVTYRVSKGNALVEVAEHISQTERNSSEAEMESKKLKLLEWLDTKAVNPPQLTLKKALKFKALVTDARPMGLIIELQDTMLRGLVKSRDFPSGYWQFNQQKRCYISKKKGKLSSLKIGDQISVAVKYIDFDRMRVDFIFAAEE